MQKRKDRERLATRQQQQATERMGRKEKKSNESRQFSRKRAAERCKESQQERGRLTSVAAKRKQPARRQEQRKANARGEGAEKGVQKWINSEGYLARNFLPRGTMYAILAFDDILVEASL
jgi:hypothetical protein